MTIVCGDTDNAYSIPFNEKVIDVYNNIVGEELQNINRRIIIPKSVPKRKTANFS